MNISSESIHQSWSDSEFWEGWLVSAVVAVGKILRLSGFQSTENVICSNASIEMLIQLLALLILKQSHDSVIICALN